MLFKTYWTDMRAVVLTAVLITATQDTFAQKAIPITWKTLSDVSFKEEYNKEYDFKVMVPKFGKSVKDLEGKTIEISGYAIPIEEVGYKDILVLSANPYSQCFFCGMAGPESIMDIKPKKKIKGIKMDKKLKVRGVLELNERDLSKLNYVLKNAELVE
jgi:hypothetical protein